MNKRSIIEGRSGVQKMLDEELEDSGGYTSDLCIQVSEVRFFSCSVERTTGTFALDILSLHLRDDRFRRVLVMKDEARDRYSDYGVDSPRSRTACNVRSSVKFCLSVLDTCVATQKTIQKALESGVSKSAVFCIENISAKSTTSWQIYSSDL